MKFKSLTLFSCLCLLLISACKTPEAENRDSEIVGVAQVQTTPLVYSEISAKQLAYGSVIALDNTLNSISLPYACRIEAIHVSHGQAVRAGQTLLSVQPTEDSVLQVKQAQQELASALQEQQSLQARLQLKLVSEHDLVSNRLRVAQAKALVQDLSSRGSLTQHTIKTEKSGVITSINVQVGQRLAASSPLIQWTTSNQWRVILGVEPALFEQLQAKQTVLISPINRSLEPAISGKIESINQQIDANNHLLNVIVSLEERANLLLNEQVKAEIILENKPALLAPSAAILANAEGYSVFTVVDQHAVKHQVQLGIEDQDQVEIIAPSLKDQDQIVILGHYELADGMRVEVQQP